MNYQTMNNKNISELKKSSTKEIKEVLDKTLFTWYQIPIIINILNEKEMIVLGGDVFKKTNKSFEHIDENWFVNKNKEETKDEFRLRSYKETTSFLVFYNDDKLYFNLVVKN